MTSFENVYYEATEGYAGIGDTEHGVAVTVRRWSSDYARLSREDVVLHAVAIVDGECVVDSRKFLPPGQELSWYQRRGMEQYDKTLQSHPYFSQQKLQALSA